MQTEIDFIISQLKDAYAGEPWFGRNVKELLREVAEPTAFIRLNNQHSILELVWHMITWREFTIYCLKQSPGLTLKYFESLDWREIDHSDQSLWADGLRRLDEIQTELIDLLQQQDDSILEQGVRERGYNFRKLINGIIQHDIYHLGQIAFINKALNNK
jgi:uncharacterized damage-inducible protein DinB